MMVVWTIGDILQVAIFAIFGVIVVGAYALFGAIQLYYNFKHYWRNRNDKH